jgi:Leucine-rich repeat (LRR) protein
MIMNDSLAPKPKRRWFQFSLRTLLLTMFLAACLVGWVAWRLRAPNLKKLEAVGGRVWGKGDGPREVCFVSYICTPYGSFLDERNEAVADADLWHLKAVPNLRSLELSHTNISDDGLVHLRRLRTLAVLELEDARVTDAGLAHLKQLPQLESLNIMGTSVSNAGIVHLKQLTSLDSIDIADSRITERGKAALKGALPRASVGPIYLD